MFKKSLLMALALWASAVFAAPEVNKASAAELDSVKGIGPALSSRILDERKKGEFKNWADLMARVKGVGARSAARFSEQGLTVNGEAFKAAAKAAAATDKPAVAAKSKG